MVGNTPNYAREDVLRCFLLLDQKICRLQLAKYLGLGEGTIRSILSILKQRNLIDSNTMGHYITQKGKVMLNQVNSLMTMQEVHLTIYPKKHYVALSISATEPISLLHRDLAVKAGADGAVIIPVRDGRLDIKEGTLADDFAMNAKEFPLDETKIVIVTFALSQKTAQQAALLVATNINKELRRIVEQYF